MRSNGSYLCYSAAMTGAFVDRIAETKGLDTLDKERAKRMGEFECCVMDRLSPSRSPSPGTGSFGAFWRVLSRRRCLI